MNKGAAKRLAFFLPNSFTALNIACGFGSVLLSFQGEFYNASMILILGALFDSVDGRIARLTGSQSNFGEQFDSISDVVTFGMAPAMLVYFRFFSEMGRVGIIISFVFLLCGALRLARFNANIDDVNSEQFQGLPIPVAALALVGYVLISLEFEIINKLPIVAGFYVAFYAVLMITNIPFTSFKKSDWVRNHKKRVLALIFLLVCLVFIYEHLMMVVLVSLYVFGSLIHSVFFKGGWKKIFLWKNENENE